MPSDNGAKIQFSEFGYSLGERICTVHGVKHENQPLLALFDQFETKFDHGIELAFYAFEKTYARNRKSFNANE